MKRIIIFLSLFLLVISCKAQSPGIFTFVIVRDSAEIPTVNIETLLSITGWTKVTEDFVQDGDTLENLVDSIDIVTMIGNIGGNVFFTDTVSIIATKADTISKIATKYDIDSLYSSLLIYAQDSNWVSTTHDTIFFDDDGDYFITMGESINTLYFYFDGETVTMYDASGGYSGTMIESDYILINDSICNRTEGPEEMNCVSIDDLYTVVSSGGSGSVDFSGIPDGRMIYADDDTASYSSKFNILFSTMNIQNSTNDTGLYLINSNVGEGIIVDNTSSGNGITINNQSTGTGFHISSVYGTGSYISSSNGNASYIYTTNSATGLIINNLGSGNSLQVQDDGDDVFVIDSSGGVHMEDSLWLNVLEDAQNDEQWLGLSHTNAVFADSLVDAGFGLADELLPIDEYLNNFQYNEKTGFNELLWKYWNGKEFIEEYSIKGRPSVTIQKLQWGIEHSFRYIQQLEDENMRMKARIYDIEEKLKTIEQKLSE